MNNGVGDFHTHTTASDGTQAPAANVRMAKKAGLAAIAITDHDTVAGIPEAKEEGERLGIAVVPGVEISTVAGGQDIHVLGYWINTEDSVFLERLADLRSVRDRRNDMLIARLNDLGLAVTMDQVIAGMSKKLSPGATVGRPHIAELLVRKGYAADMKDAFERYLGKGGAAYVNPPRIHPAEAIRWIHEAGGSAVLAHPGLYGDDSLVRELMDAGLDGIEAYHSDHSHVQAEHYAEMAGSRGLAATAGSDFHGVRGGDVFHGPLGSQTVAWHVIHDLKQRRREKPHENP